MSQASEIELQGAVLDARLDQLEAELVEMEQRRPAILQELAQIRHANSQLWLTQITLEGDSDGK
jgi:uncharacterized Zn finger protein